ncbi:MAG TPA: PEP-CTERM sorting domain-containing protein [Aquabacterium sp.]|nr:PEP-CTERM sorting domain-containing protein [Aquabacterium sp.]
MFKKALLVLTGCLSCLSSFAAPVQWAGNGHWYEYIDTNLTWDDAFAAANASTFMGMSGYLATVTSEAENTFVSISVANGSLAWLGGSDAGAAVNEWTWRNGPEAGQAFTYANWLAGEPNNCCGGEDYVHTNFISLAGWNDHGGPGNAGQANGYLVEYSAPVPEPLSVLLTVSGLAVVGVSTRRRRGRVGAP